MLVAVSATDELILNNLSEVNKAMKVDNASLYKMRRAFS